MSLKPFIKVPLVFLENVFFSIFPKLRPFIEQNFFNPYAFNEGHPAYSITKFKSFLEKIGSGSKIIDKYILELGPGGSIGFGLLALRNGAKKYYAIESISHTFITEKQMLSYRKLLENNDALIKKYFICNTDGQYAYNPTFIEFIEVGQDASYKLLDGSIDIIYSCAVLEHVHDLDLCFSEMNRVLRNGGLMYHEVDLRDHIFSQRSLWFLTISDFWFRLLFHNTGEYVNRKRMSHYKTLAKKYSFAVISLESTEEYTRSFLPGKISSRYSSEDIQVLAFNIILSKKNGYVS